MGVSSGQLAIEHVRATISALTNNVEDGSSSPVHSHRISHFLRFHVGSQEVISSLEKLESLGEVYRLANGYWYPAVTRAIALTNGFLVASALPINELARHIETGVTMAGLMRVTSSRPARLQRQRLDGWTQAPEDTKQWTSLKLAAARSTLQPTTLDAQRVEVYLAQQGKRGKNSLGAWRSINELESGPDAPLYLCREPGLGARYRYFFGECQASCVVREAPARTRDVQRLRFGIDLLAGRGLPISLNAAAGRLSFDLWRRLPKEETRVLDALATQVPGDGFRVTYTFEHQHLETLRPMLKKLGIHLEAGQ